MTSFTPLTEEHFPMLLKWLSAPHVKFWWDKDMEWTLEKIETKYSSYTKGYKYESGQRRQINAYIICTGTILVGYVQFYNAYDFARPKPLENLPLKLAAFDIFIGEEKYLNCGLGSIAINQFLADCLDTAYTHIFADPDVANITAIRAYEKVGFKEVARHLDVQEVWMLKEVK